MVPEIFDNFQLCPYLYFCLKSVFKLLSVDNHELLQLVFVPMTMSMYDARVEYETQQPHLPNNFIITYVLFTICKSVNVM